MARNQEKQLGRLNRLWLEKERQDGHLKDAHRTRPRLSALNSAPDVKKWIPSIKKEIEYFLESVDKVLQCIILHRDCITSLSPHEMAAAKQSQLPHYSERKIQEFEEHIEILKKDYQSHLWKLRRLDPSCKDHPWKLRGYTRKRPVDASVPTGNEAADPPCAKILYTPVLHKDIKQDTELDNMRRTEVDAPSCLDEAKGSSTLYDSTNVDTYAQDQPLTFSQKMNPKQLWESSPYSTLGEDVLKMKGILLGHHHSIPAKTQTPFCGSEEAEKSKSIDNVNNLLGLDCYSASSSSEDDGS